MIKSEYKENRGGSLNGFPPFEGDWTHASIDGIYVYDKEKESFPTILKTCELYYSHSKVKKVLLHEAKLSIDIWFGGSIVKEFDSPTMKYSNNLGMMIDYFNKKTTTNTIGIMYNEYIHVPEKIRIKSLCAIKMDDKEEYNRWIEYLDIMKSKERKQ